MGQHTFTFKGSDGVELFCYQWLPEQSTPWKAVVQIVHGLAEHAGRYDRLAQVLNQQQIGVYAHDLRGHGKTAGRPEQLGFFAEKDGWAKVVDDIHILNQHIAKAHPNVPRVLLGHSMGSMLAQDYIIQYSDTIRAACLSASIDNAGLLRYAGILAANLERLRLGPRGQSKLLNAMSFGDYNKPFKPNRTDFDWLSRDQAEVDKYIADPYCGFIASTQLWLDLLAALGDFAKPSQRAKVRKDLPLYLFTGSRDPVTRMGKAVDGLAKAYQTAGMQNITVKSYLDARHECFNETNRAEVTQDLIDWILRVV